MGSQGCTSRFACEKPLSGAMVGTRLRVPGAHARLDLIFFAMQRDSVANILNSRLASGRFGLNN
jgi:hypothetical protein